MRTHDVAAALWALAAITSGACGQATFEVVATSSNPLNVWGLSGDGGAIVGSGNYGADRIRGWHWTWGSGFEWLGPTSQDSTAYAASYGGSVIAFNWGGLKGRLLDGSFTPLAGTPVESIAAVSADGRVLAGHFWGTQRGYRWSEADGFQDLAMPPGCTRCFPAAMSEDGQCVTGSLVDQDGHDRGFLWTRGTMQLIEPLPGQNSTDAWGISPEGRVVVGSSFTTPGLPHGVRGFVWRSSEGTRALPAPVGFMPNAVSRNGEAVSGYFYDGLSPSRDFVWTGAGGLRWLDEVLVEQGAVLTTAMGHGSRMSHDGRTFANAFAGAVWRATLPASFGCYANCDGSFGPAALNVADFVCFVGRFAAGDAYANCDGSTGAPVLNVADFTCFLQRFAAGCP
jgi:hypothetical protein